ncbi:ABC transporter permease [Staphylococcus hominis]|uniref:ABC transporter permease n=2 Tax=Staphylococcus hominis TaxID=1290 RepID=A0A974QNI1_STAHO|nr:ABC transporter permease [Staphylococcus hominis]MCE4949448.1 ABC transporter permease [Staphylococcus hominis]MCE4951578.1 ABC transporter permease [Staphylococcus hominis]MCE4975260.1 ABC transporter permease [Staphylococcus hominis]PTK20285.1 ABC transporter permease [Staphylococcus hominis]PTK24781.1 ABC transporter permease [Staphylococcus hominis]
MNNIALLKTEFKIIFRKKLTTFLSIILPVGFYLLFTSLLDLPEEAKQQFYKEYMYSMTVFSLMSFCLMQFPLDIIEERNTGWFKRLMVTPLSSKIYFIIKVIKTMLLFLLSILLIFVVAHLYKNVNMSIQHWLLSGVSLWIGASLFLTLGLVIAQFNETQKANSIANIINMLLAILGGLWFPVQTFPIWLQKISKITPTYHLKNLALELVKNQGLNITSLFTLIVYSILFLILAMWINQRKEVN